MNRTTAFSGAFVFLLTIGLVGWMIPSQGAPGDLLAGDTASYKMSGITGLRGKAKLKLSPAQTSTEGNFEMAMDGGVLWQDFALSVESDFSTTNLVHSSIAARKGKLSSTMSLHRVEKHYVMEISDSKGTRERYMIFHRVDDFGSLMARLSAANLAGTILDLNKERVHYFMGKCVGELELEVVSWGDGGAKVKARAASKECQEGSDTPPQFLKTEDGKTTVHLRQRSIVVPNEDANLLKLARFKARFRKGETLPEAVEFSAPKDETIVLTR